MKFSILLPTVDRNELLRLAAGSVVDQSFQDWELVVSDNASAQTAKEGLSDLVDQRFVFIRHEQRIPVTQNWNAAMDGASGDYRIMLGDDDALAAGSLERLAELADAFDQPDLIFASAWFYAWPGVVDGYPRGFVKRDTSPIFSATEPYLLEGERARELVRSSMHLRMHFPYNMQFSIMHRRLVERLAEGGLYRSPYPDYYATNAAFWAAKRILIVPEPMTLIGISPKSYGNSHLKGREQDGALLHGSEDLLRELPEIAGSLLPGSRSMSCFLAAMGCLGAAFPELGAPDIVKYRRRQVEYMTRRRFMTGEVDAEAYRDFVGKLTLSERLRWQKPLALAARILKATGLQGSGGLLKFAKRITGNVHQGILEIERTTEPPAGVDDILSAQRWLASEAFAASSAP